MTEKDLARPLPAEGCQVISSPGNKFTRINLDLGGDGVTLAMVGAASALKENNRHSVTLRPTKEGIVLSVVGAAAAAR